MLAQSPATAQVSPARLLQYHVLPAGACQKAERCPPQQSNEIQMCMPGLYQYALLLCGGSNRGT